MFRAKPYAAVVTKASAFAKKAHAGQKRTSGEPFFTHLQSVADLLKSIGADDETVAAAFLHDTIEDTDVTAKKLEKEFGPVITHLVEGVTKVQQLEKTFDKRTRNMESIRKMFRTMGRDIRVLYIKLADRLHNMQTLGVVPLEKQARVAQETLDIYCPLAKLLGMQKWYEELSDLCFRALDPREYEILRRKHMQTEKAQLPALEKWIGRMEEFLKKNLVHTQKMELMQRNLSEVRSFSMGQEDMLKHVETFHTLCIRLKNTADPYRCLGLVHQFSSPVPGAVNDYIASPKVNGYQALHTTVIDSAGVPITVMIQTEKMYQSAWMGLKNVFTQRRQYATPEWVEELLSLDEKETGLQAFFLRLQSEIFGERNHVTLIQGKTKKSMDLPPYSSAMDLAFYVDGKTGATATQAVVNGRRCSLRQYLHDGDTVEIVTETGKTRRSAEDLYMIHTALGHSRLVDHLSALPETEKERRGTELLRKAFQITMDPFYSIHWQKDVYASLPADKAMLKSIGAGVVDPYRFLENHSAPQSFFLLDPRCFHVPSGLLPGSVMRYVLRAGRDELSQGDVLGIQVAPDVIEVVSAGQIQRTKKHPLNKEILPLRIQQDVIEHPFSFALRWTFDSSVNPLKDIAVIESFLDSPVMLLQFNPSSVVLGFRTDTIRTLDSVYKHLWSLPHVTDIFRVTP